MKLLAFRFTFINLFIDFWSCWRRVRVKLNIGVKLAPITVNIFFVLINPLITFFYAYNARKRWSYKPDDHNRDIILRKGMSRGIIKTLKRLHFAVLSTEYADVLIILHILKFSLFFFSLTLFDDFFEDPLLFLLEF